MKLFRDNRNLPVILITLLVLVSLGALYFFVYLPHNEKDLQEQRFRALQNIDRNIHAKIENSTALLNNLLSSYQKKINGKDSTEVTNYIVRFPKENFILTPVKKIPHQIWKDSLDSAYVIDVNNNTRQINLFFRKKFSTTGSDTVGHEIGMEFSFEQFIRFLLPENIFDEYIVFSKGKPVYETFPAGINEIKEDSLLRAKSGIKASGLHNYNISGKEYKLFIQPVSFTSDKEWIIGGLLSNKRYQKEKNQLPSEIILLLLTLVIGMLLMFPVIKLFQMGNKDRLTIWDGIWSILTSMLLMSLLFLAFFKYNGSFRPVISPDSKKILANNISQALKKEIDTAYSTLDRYDIFLKRNKSQLDSNIIFLKSAPAYYNYKQKIKEVHDTLETKLADSLKEIGKITFIKQIFWLNDNGDELRNWNTDSIVAPHGNFNARDYFKRIREKKTYFLDDNMSKRFYLDQIISWTSGAFTTVLSIPSRDTGTVAGISFKMQSLENVLLPTGYQFALIDDAGKVLYHSQVARNLNENLLNEFSENDELTSSLMAHAEFSFSTKYFNRLYNVRVSPLTGLPYFLVILEDTGYIQTRHIEIYSFTFSMLLLFFVFLIIELLIIFFVSAKRSFFKKQFFDTSWIGPKQSSEEQYFLTAAFNIITISLLILFFFLTTFLTYLFMLFISVTAASLFLNTLFAIRYKSEELSKYRYKRNAIRCLVILMLIITISASIKLEPGHTAVLFTFELLLFTTGVLVFTTRQMLMGKLNDVKKHTFFKTWDYINSFSFMALTRLIITSGIPIVFFYLASYNYEQNIAIRYKQTEFAKQLIDKAIDTAGSFKKISSIPGVYIDSAWIKGIDTVLINDVSRFEKDTLKIENYSPEEMQTLKMLRLFRLYITDEAVNEEKFYTARSDDSSFFYNHLLKNACETRVGTVTYSQTHVPGKYFKLSSSSLNYNLPGFFKKNAVLNGFGFWIFLLGALVIFYFIIYNIIKKLFALGVPDLKKSLEVDNKILEDQKLNKLVFVLGSPGARKKFHILEKIKQGKIKSQAGKTLTVGSDIEINNDVFIADMIHIPDSANDNEDVLSWKEYTNKIFAKKNKVIIINHFEYNIQDPVTNRIKLNFLEKLMVDDNRKIIILSTIHPVAFLDSAFVESMKQDTGKDDKNNRAEIPIQSQDLERWHVLLGHYRIILMPLDPAYTQLQPEDETPSGKMICNETKWGYFLNQMREPAIKASRKIIKKGIDLPTPDEFAFKLQVTSHYFYMYIWQSLTREEKFLLYDLAEDNLVNSYDDYNLSMLIGKGIIFWDDGTLKLFNKGFRNFILTAIGNSEAMKIKDRIKDNGNWGKLRIPLILIILSILAFLLASQEEAYSTLITYVAALTAGVPAVLKIFSLFDRNTQKAN
jgi:hypothetical protein